MVARTGVEAAWLGHPAGLYILALTETWERFSYYGMRALLVFFLTERFVFSDAESFAIYGSYTALVYISPIVGGILADRYLGFSKAVFFGGLLMVVGHFGLALEDWVFPAEQGPDTGEARLQLFYLSLAFLIAGVGLLKPNISTMVGELYPAGGAARDSGFTLFVCGVNTGATASALACGYVGHTYGWGYGFGLAGIGMVLGLVTFAGGRGYLRGIGEPADPVLLRRKLFGGLSLEAAIYVAVLLAVFGIWQLVQRTATLGFVVGCTFVLATGWSLVFGMKRLSTTEQQRIRAALLLMTIWVCFAALIEQMGSSLNLFTERAVDRTIGTLQVGAAQLQGLLPFLIIVISPLFAWLWGYLERRRINPSTPAKFAGSLFFLAFGYAAIALAAFWPDEQGRVHMLWLFVLYLLFAVGDLLIVPVGLSVVTKLAPREILGYMMGLWMLSVAIGNYFAAGIARLSALDPGTQATTQAEDVLLHYQSFFGQLAVVSLLLGVLATAMVPLIRRWMHGVR